MKMLQTNPTIIKDIHAFPAVRRLVVLVPDAWQIDEYALGCYIHKLAQVHHSDILYLSAIQKYDDDLPTQRKLDALASISRDLLIEATSEICFDVPWLKAVQKVWRPGDLVVCIQGHTIKEWGFAQKEICDLLVTRLGVNVYVLSNNGRADL